MRFMVHAVGSAMEWAERQQPLELALSIVAIAAIVYVVCLIAESPAR